MSSRIVVCTLMMLACGLSAQAQKEAMPQTKLASSYLVKITDMVGEETYEVMSREGVAELQKTINDETRQYTAVMIAVKREWSDDETTKGTPFPSAAFSIRKMQAQGPFSEEKANQKKEVAMERDTASFTRGLEREKKKKEDDKKKGIQPKEPSAKDKEREAKREATLQKAQEKVMAKMEEFLKRDAAKKNGL